MKMRSLYGIPALACSIALAPALSAQEKKVTSETKVTTTEKKVTSETKSAKKMPSQEEMMKAWMEVATPGEAHKKLEPMVGTFEAKVKSTMDPSKPPEESTGTSENTWVLGGRFIEQKVTGSMMGQPFNGLGYSGYDNYKKKYVGTWMDSMGTMIMMMEGTMDSTGKTMTASGKMDDIMMKKTVTVTSKTTVQDNDHHTYEMWCPGPDGKMMKMLEIHYTRKK